LNINNQAGYIDSQKKKRKKNSKDPWFILKNIDKYKNAYYC